jgi:hypothetical protein
MTITIDLSPEQEAKLQAVASSKGTDPQSILMGLVEALPNDELQSQPSETESSNSAHRRKTTAEILAGWDAEGLPSVYARDPEDATVIARRLRSQAESRASLK